MGGAWGGVGGNERGLAYAVEVIHCGCVIPSLGQFGGYGEVSVVASLCPGFEIGDVVYGRGLCTIEFGGLIVVVGLFASYRKPYSCTAAA